MNQQQDDTEMQSVDDLFASLKTEQSSSKSRRNPFKFLDPYTIEDRDLFFGREFEISELYRKFYASRLLLVYGESGSGKTSLIQCGLQSEIPVEEALFIPVRTALDIEASLRQELAKYLTQTDGNIPQLFESLWKQQRKTLVLVLDQFEEFFLLRSRSERQQFAEDLQQWLASNADLRLIISIREEYYARLTELEEHFPKLFKNRLWVRRMTREQTREVITKPCEICAIEIESELTHKLLDDLSEDGKETDLPTLQVVLDSLYNEAKTRSEDVGRVSNSVTNQADDKTNHGNAGFPQSSNPAYKQAITLSLSAYKELGKIDNILANFIQKRIEAHDNGEALRQVLKAMVTAQGTRKISKLDDIQQRLSSFGPERDTQELSEILQQLSNDRIIREDTDNGLYELRHDSLANAIAKWMTKEEKDLVEIRQMIENRYKEYLQRGILLNRETLQLVLPFESQLNLNGKVLGFIEESKRVSRQKRKRLFILSALLMIIVFGAISFSWLQAIEGKAEAERQKNIAEEQTKKVEKQKKMVIEQTKEVKKQKERAEQQAKIAEEKSQLAEKQAEKAKKQEKKALEQTKKAEHRFGLIMNEKADQAFKEKNFNEAKLYAQYALQSLKPDSKEFTASLGEINTGREVSLIYSRKLPYTGGTNIVRFSTDRKTLITVVNKTVQFYDIKSGKVINEIIQEDKISNIKISSNGKTLALLLYNDNYFYTIKVFNVKDNKIVATLDLGKHINVFDFMSDGKQLAILFNNKGIKLWDIKIGEYVKTLEKSDGSKSIIRYSPNGKFIAGGRYGITKIWEVSTGKIVKILAGYKNHINDICFSPDGSLLALAFGNGPGKQNNVELWDISTEKSQIFKGHTDAVTNVDFSSNGKQLFSISRRGGKLIIWDVNTGIKKSTLTDNSQWGSGSNSRSNLH